MQRFTALRNLLLLLTLLTLFGLLTHAFWMKRVVRIDGFGPGQQLLAVDHSEGGGRSEAQLIRNKEGALLRCRLSTQYAWPYCDLQVQFGPDGLDMGRFDTLKQWLRPWAGHLTAHLSAQKRRRACGNRQALRAQTA